MEAQIIVNPKFTYYIICAMDAHIIVNQKFTKSLIFNQLLINSNSSWLAGKHPFYPWQVECN